MTDRYVDPNTIPGFYRANPDYQGEDVIETGSEHPMSDRPVFRNADGKDLFDGTVPRSKPMAPINPINPTEALRELNRRAPKGHGGCLPFVATLDALAALPAANTPSLLMRHDEHLIGCVICGERPAALSTPPSLDVEALAEAIFRIGTGYRQRETASIPARIANSQDGAKAAGEFAELVAAEYPAARAALEGAPHDPE